MDATTPDPFADIVSLAQATFADADFSIDITPERAIFRLEAHYGPYRVLVIELASGEGRQYRYYVLSGDGVEVGFDNAADPRAIRLKYGGIGEAHAGESVPHVHRRNKSELSLTDDVSFAVFVDWLKANL